MGQDGEVYPLARDQTESARLNDQHNIIVDLVGGVIDSSIPLDKIHAVADVGTGTGIWLQEARSVLAKSSPKPDRYFHGFDISAAQFPPSTTNFDFSVQDILKPFPQEHHNCYDLVYIRMLVSVLSKTDYATAVANLLQILKPGGYVQWVELDSSAWDDGNLPSDPRAALIIQTWLSFFDLNDLSKCPPKTIRDTFETSGLEVMTMRTFSMSENTTRQRAQKWQYQAFDAVAAVLMLKTGVAADMESAKERAADTMRGLQEWLSEGNLLDLKFGTVVGRKSAL
ncbi:hypothetical protein BJY04DRAFT_232113 [Aspergillus karnatakaensis]|uniref:class I SAM-dependent methyltransferase n=1 Tax=Aspergillus karnatakaensis TaxID=1810916 RepID=UPI003CCDE821